VLPVYVLSDADLPRYQSAAMARHGAAEGPTLAWLRLYFEEVVAPAAQAQRRLLDATERRGGGGCQLLRVDGESPAGAEEWADARVPEVVAFVTSLKAG
jgi:hypothetical protein